IVEKKYPVEKIVFASSQSVSGEGKYECDENGQVFPEPRSTEQMRRGGWEIKCPACGADMRPLLIYESTVHPHTAYAISKYAIELLARNLGRRYEIPTSCIRYT